jgi:hypothetical protein
LTADIQEVINRKRKGEQREDNHEDTEAIERR